LSTSRHIHFQIVLTVLVLVCKIGYVLNSILNGTNPTRLTNNFGNDILPDWSPDGSMLAFHSERDGNAKIYVMNADGSGQTRLTNNPAFLFTDFDPRRKTTMCYYVKKMWTPVSLGMVRNRAVACKIIICTGILNPAYQ
jgi:hypothetical protein